MKIETKRIIAKEVIYLFCVILLIALIWMVIILRNTYINNKVENYSNNIVSLKSTLKPVTNIRFLNKKEKNQFDYNLRSLNEYEEKDKQAFMIDYISKFSKKEVSKINEEDIDEIFYITPNKSYVSESLLKFAYGNEFDSLKKNKIFKVINIKSIIDFNKRKKINKLNLKIKNLNEKQKKYSEIKTLIFCLSIILFCLLYPFRLIYKLLKWAFLTLKKND